jgi:hypothetical protein
MLPGSVVEGLRAMRRTSLLHVPSTMRIGDVVLATRSAPEFCFVIARSDSDEAIQQGNKRSLR